MRFARMIGAPRLGQQRSLEHPLEHKCLWYRNHEPQAMAHHYARSRSLLLSGFLPRSPVDGGQNPYRPRQHDDLRLHLYNYLVHGGFQY